MQPSENRTRGPFLGNGGNPLTVKHVVETGNKRTKKAVTWPLIGEKSTWKCLGGKRVKTEAIVNLTYWVAADFGVLSWPSVLGSRIFPNFNSISRLLFIILLPSLLHLSGNDGLNCVWNDGGKYQLYERPWRLLMHLCIPQHSSLQPQIGVHGGTSHPGKCNCRNNQR